MRQWQGALVGLLTLLLVQVQQRWLLAGICISCVASAELLWQDVPCYCSLPGRLLRRDQV
jgi:hypothetical protein